MQIWLGFHIKMKNMFFNSFGMWNPAGRGFWSFPQRRSCPVESIRYFDSKNKPLNRSQRCKSWKLLGKNDQIMNFQCSTKLFLSAAQDPARRRSESSVPLVSLRIHGGNPTTSSWFSSSHLRGPQENKGSSNTNCKERTSRVQRGLYRGLVFLKEEMRGEKNRHENDVKIQARQAL